MILVKVRSACGEAFVEIFRSRGFVTVDEMFCAGVEPGFAELAGFDVFVRVFGGLLDQYVLAGLGTPP